jgi:hypothetical protein
MSASVRDNITFHHEYDEVFYGLVLEGEPSLLCDFIGDTMKFPPYSPLRCDCGCDVPQLVRFTQIWMSFRTVISPRLARRVRS